jgi:hypothetical protein
MQIRLLEKGAAVEEIRDYVIIVAVIVAGLTTFAITLALAFVGWKTFKGVRWLRRQHDARLAPLIASAASQIGSMNDQMSTGSGAFELLLSGYRGTQSKRNRRKKSRLQRLRKAVSDLRSG